MTREEDCIEFFELFQKMMREKGVEFSFYQSLGDGGIHWGKINDISEGFYKIPYISVELLKRGGYIRVQVYIPNDKELYGRFKEDEIDIEKECGGGLIWRDDAKYMRKIEKRIYGLNFNDKPNYPELIKELISTVERFVKVFDEKLEPYRKFTEREKLANQKRFDVPKRDGYACVISEEVEKTQKSGCVSTTLYRLQKAAKRSLVACKLCAIVIWARVHAKCD